VSAAIGRPAEWLDTGDRVELRGRRVAFLGRTESRVVSIGGAKLFAGDIEAVVLQHPAVSWCRVRGVRAPLVGNLPEVDFVVNPGYPSPTDAELMAHCRAGLPEPGIPRFWNRLKSIPIQASLKSEL
jgi:acyl-CoA synthetase (AMP-forming)/AMP-acid ligase II